MTRATGRDVSFMGALPSSRIEMAGWSQAMRVRRPGQAAESPWTGSRARGLASPQRAVPGGRQSECGLEGTGEVRLVREPHVARDLHEWALTENALARELQAAHEQVPVGARAEHDPELAGEVVARQAGDRLQLRRMHDARSLRGGKLPRALAD